MCVCVFVVVVVVLLNHCMEYYVQNILVWMEWGGGGQGGKGEARNSSLGLAEVKQLPNCPILQIEDFEPFIL